MCENEIDDPFPTQLVVDWLEANAKSNLSRFPEKIHFFADEVTWENTLHKLHTNEVRREEHLVTEMVRVWRWVSWSWDQFIGGHTVLIFGTGLAMLSNTIYCPWVTFWYDNFDTFVIQCVGFASLGEVNSNTNLVTQVSESPSCNSLTKHPHSCTGPRCPYQAGEELG